jgi:hypothetical protein
MKHMDDPGICHSWEDNIEMHLQEIICESMKLVRTAQNGAK